MSKGGGPRTNAFDFSQRVSKEGDGITGIVEVCERMGDTDSPHLALEGLKESLRVLDPLGRQKVAQALEGFIEEGMYDSHLLDRYPEADQDYVSEMLREIIGSLQEEE
jgi:hypothetical protein